MERTPALTVRVLEAVQDLQEALSPVTRARLVCHLFDRDPSAWSLPGAPHYPDSKRVDACVSKLIQRGQLDHVGASEYVAPVRRAKAPPGPPPAHLQLVPKSTPPPSGELTPAELWELARMARSPVIGKARRGGSPLTLQDARVMFGPHADLKALADASAQGLDRASRFIAYTGSSAISPRDRGQLVNVCRILKEIVEQANLSSQAG